MKRKITFLIGLMVFLCMASIAVARMMPGEYQPEKRQQRVAEYIPFAVQKTFQPTCWQCDPQIVVVTGTIEKNFKLFKRELDNEAFARDEKKLLYNAFRKLGWKKVDARNHLQDIFGEIDITYEKRNRGPISWANIEIGEFSIRHKRHGSEDRAAWFAEEVAGEVNLRIKEQFQFEEMKGNR